MEPRLIFDIGMCNGDDSAYYLSLGHKVVGVEANPVLTSMCAQRFAIEIEQQRITIVNAGILERAGEFNFYHNLTNSEWSSFDRNRGIKGGKWEELRIPCITTRDLIQRFGIPFFMKVDIEGADLQTLKSLNHDLAPAYVSLELNCRDPIIETLINLGYSAFKFVDGFTYRPAPPIFDHDIGWRLLRKAGRIVPPVRNAISKLPQRFRCKDEYNPPGKFSPDGYQFTDCSSGPLGEQAGGEWLPAAYALRWFEKLKRDYRRDGKETLLWWDIHARREPFHAVPNSK